MTPREIVARLDLHIVGQAEAKRAVAIALRNRWRRQRLSDDMRRDSVPKNILMIGPTGVGKTEIARRLAALVNAPFCKVEATKYTEVGYHGRDVESVVRDLAEAAFRLVRDEERERVRPEAERRAEDRILSLLLPAKADRGKEEEEPTEGRKAARARLKKMLDAGELEDRTVTIKVEQRPPAMPMLAGMGSESAEMDLQGMFERLMPKSHRQRTVTVKEARKTLILEESDALLDKDALGEKAARLAEESGIIFIDEIDKVSGPASTHGPDVSRQGVQRDLLPIVEGTAVQTKYGVIRTDHVLFIAAGAFHVSKPSDMMPELQGRFPIRVELKDLDRADFVRILTEPQNSLAKQYTALLATEGFDLTFTPDGLEALAEIAFRVNKSTENIGARRLHTVLEKLLDEANFEAPDASDKSLVVDAVYVNAKLAALSQDQDLSRFIL
ncbi:MAG TPA: ATP-dependent protease ATPase subunit HslU [Planctomycetia bacterium]|nr:ATP-dependent protease ATPase subunit HslU [Planctomycetia bacterium]